MKKNIALLTGGYSEEYEISIKSGKVIASHLDHNLFNVYLIKIAADRWTYQDETGKEYSVDLNGFALELPEGRVTFDAAFIGIHGTPGEDGKLQGYLDMMQVPYNTCGRVTAAYSAGGSQSSIWLPSGSTMRAKRPVSGVSHSPGRVSTAMPAASSWPISAVRSSTRRLIIHCLSAGK